MSRQKGRHKEPEENQANQNARLQNGTAHGAAQRANQKAARQKQGDQLVERAGICSFGCDAGHGTKIRIGIGAYPDE